MTLSFDPSRIPAELRAKRRWVLWRWSWKPSKRAGEEGKGRWDKPPRQWNGRLASVDKPETWASFDAAAQALRGGKFDGLGYVLDEGEVGIDLDAAVENGKLLPWAAPLATDLATYTDASPSGTGAKMLCRGIKPEGVGCKRAYGGGEIEVYDQSSPKYFTLTGHAVVGCEVEAIEERTAEVSALCELVWGEPTQKAQPRRQKADPPAAGEHTPQTERAPSDFAGFSDQEVPHRMASARNGAAIMRLWQGDTGDHGGDQSSADMALVNHLWFWCRGDEAQIDRLFRQSRLMRDKWDEVHYADGGTYGEGTIAKARGGKIYEPPSARCRITRAGAARNGKAAAGPPDGQDGQEDGQEQDQQPNTLSPTMDDVRRVWAKAKERRTRDLLERLKCLAQARDGSALKEALEPGNIAFLADLAQQSRRDLEVFFTEIVGAGLKTREIATIRSLIKDRVKEVRERQHAESRELARQTRPPATDASFTNFRTEEMLTEDGAPRQVRVGLSVQALAEQASQLTGGWPYRVGPLLFVEGPDHQPKYLETANALCAHLCQYLPSGDTNAMSWAAGPNMVTEGRFHEYLCQTVRNFIAVEPYPHVPPQPDVYYMHPTITNGDGDHFRHLVDQFTPATDVDRMLLEAFFLSLIWGGRPGRRPAWLFTAADDDPQGGRQVGKSTVAKLGSRLVGGFINIDANADMDKILTRLLSPEALKLRVGLLDNVKTLKLSWGQLENLITAPIISGHRMYHGEAQRPNNLTYCITLNGASLSKDMALRCVNPRLGRPRFDPDWEATTENFIDRHRWEIISDIKARLEGYKTPLSDWCRWSEWERDVLACVGDPRGCQAEIMRRQAEMDEDGEEQRLMREHFANRLREHRYDHEGGRLFIPSIIAGCWVTEVKRDLKSVSAACAHLTQLSIPGLRRGSSDRTRTTRGYIWTGHQAEEDAPLVVVRVPTDP